MHLKNIKKFGCYALTAGLVLGGFMCSPWIASSLFASTNYPVSPGGTKSSVIETKALIKAEPTVVYRLDPEMDLRVITPGPEVWLPVETPFAEPSAPVTEPPSISTPTSVLVTQPPSTPMPPSAPVTQPPSTPKTTSARVTQPPSKPIPASEQTSKRTSVTSTAEPTVTEVTKQEEIVQRFYVGKKQYYTNDRKNEMDTAPVIKGGRTLMPIRYVSETFGAKVDWNSKDRKVTISFEQKLIELWIGKDAAVVDGTLRRLDVAPEIIDGRTVLPLRFVSENLGLKVNWDGDLKEIKITN